MKKLTLLFVLTLIMQTELSSQCLPDGITFSTQTEIDSFQTNFPGCSEIEGSVTIIGDDITNLNGLNVLISIGYYLKIGDFFGEGNPRLKSLAGLENLISIGGSLICARNDSLKNLTGLESLTLIEESIWIDLNPRMENLNGLLNLTSLGYNVGIGGNNTLTSLSGLDNLVSIYDLGIEGNPALENLLNLTNLSQVTSIYIKDNTSLLSLEGLDNIEANSVDYLSIIDNNNLTACEVEFVCDYLAYSNNYIWVENNAIGCNSEEEIAEACYSWVSDFGYETKFTIYPNPAKMDLFISSENEESISEVIIYDQFGKKVVNQINVISELDISSLRKGAYIIEITSNELTIREKLIINE